LNINSNFDSEISAEACLILFGFSAFFYNSLFRDANMPDF